MSSSPFKQTAQSYGRTQNNQKPAVQTLSYKLPTRSSQKNHQSNGSPRQVLLHIRNLEFTSSLDRYFQPDRPYPEVLLPQDFIEKRALSLYPNSKMSFLPKKIPFKKSPPIKKPSIARSQLGQKSFKRVCGSPIVDFIKKSQESKNAQSEKTNEMVQSSSEGICVQKENQKVCEENGSTLVEEIASMVEESLRKSNEYSSEANACESNDDQNVFEANDGNVESADEKVEANDGNVESADENVEAVVHESNDDQNVADSNEGNVEAIVIESNDGNVEAIVVESNDENVADSNEGNVETIVIESNDGNVEAIVVESNDGNVEAIVVESHDENVADSNEGNVEAIVIESNDGNVEIIVAESTDGVEQVVIESADGNVETNVLETVGGIEVQDEDIKINDQHEKIQKMTTTPREFHELPTLVSLEAIFDDVMSGKQNANDLENALDSYV